MKSKPVTLEAEDMSAVIHGISAEQLPEIKKWKVGEPYTLEVKVELTSVSKSPVIKDAEIHASFKVLEVKNLGNTSAIEKLNEKVS